MRAALCLALALGACAPAVLTAPNDPVIRQRMALMDQFESWLHGFQERLREGSPETARSSAAEAVFVLRNRQLWDSRDMAASVVPRERLLQVARWEAQRAAAGLPGDLRALTALAELDEIASDREGAAWARCGIARISASSFNAQAGCARALAEAGQAGAAAEAWQRAQPLRAAAETKLRDERAPPRAVLPASLAPGGEAP
ncbi:MAG: hypothetical protein ACYDCL_03905 [Myxococcales bacterium]